MPNRELPAGSEGWVPALIRAVPLVLAAGLLLLCSAGVCLAGKTRTITYAEYEDKAHGAWLGKNIGVLLGEPVEFAIQWSKPGEPHRITAGGEDLSGTQGWIRRVPDGAHDQDDIYINLISFEALEKYGIHVTPEQIAERWLFNRPGVWCANAQALANFDYRIWPPLSGHPAFSRNLTDIDAQIDVDVWGMVTPGMLRACGEYTDRAARMTNYGEGAYAAVFIASLISEAFFEKDVRKLIATARGNIPAKSEYAGMIDDVLRWRKELPDWRDARQAFAAKYEKLGGIHATVNSGAILIGLLYGEGDFERSMIVSMLCGWDCDCNPSSVGGILGAMYGARALPDKWKAPLKDIYRNSVVKAYAPGIALSELGRRTAILGERILLDRGGRVRGTGPERVLEIPVQRALRPALDPMGPEVARQARERVVAEAARDLEGTPEAQATACLRLQRVAQVERGLVTAALLERAAALSTGADRWVAAQASFLLGEAGDARAGDVLVAVAEDTAAPPAARVRALELAGHAAMPEAVGARVLRILERQPDASAPLGQAALVALGKAPDEVALRALAHVEKQDAAVRARLMKTLNAMAGGASPAVRARLEEVVALRYPEWDGAWVVKMLGPDMSPGVRAEYLGKRNVLCTHPLDQQTGAFLEREVNLEAGKKHRLEMVVASHTAEKADWELRVFADKELLEKRTIGPVEGQPRWQSVSVDLSRFAGKRVRLRLENAPNGWFCEAGYWASVQVISE